MLWFYVYGEHIEHVKGNYDGGHAEYDTSPAAFIMFLLHIFFLNEF